MANYISIKEAGSKWICTPVSEAEYQALKNAGKLEGYYFETEKTATELATAGVFGIYDSIDEAQGKIKTIDPAADMVNGPDEPISPDPTG